MRLEGENDNLAEELVGSKITLRTEMDRVSFFELVSSDYCVQLAAV